MENLKNIGLVNGEVINESEVQVASLGLKGDVQSILTTETYDSAFSGKTGLLIVSDETNGASAIISVHNAAGTATLTKLAGSANITITKDTASKVNVYYEGGVIVVQNNLAGTASILLKEYK